MGYASKLRANNEGTRMKILMILENEFPPDERVEKEIAVLQNSGFELAIAAYTFKNKPNIEKYNGYTIYRKKIPLLIYKSSAAGLIQPFYFQFWQKFICSILKKNDFGILHVHDLPLTRTALEVARKFGLKVVCDQHEYYSNWIVRTRHYNTFVGKIIKRLSQWDKYEKINLRKANMVVTVSEALRVIYINEVKIDPGKIVNLPNTPELSVFKVQNTDYKILEKYKDRFILFYGGGLDHLRGIEFICKAVSVLAKRIPEILFLVAGKENRAFSMEETIKRFDIKDHVDFVGWVQRGELPSYIAASHVCLFVPKADNMEINNTIVTKIYQYTAMGKPIVVSEARMMKEFVEKNKIGFSVDFGNGDQLCNIISKIWAEPELSVEIKRHASGIRHLISWEETSRDFLKYYIEMSKSDA
jgi:glycosyltransferase involved in cell wall biosynthesis